MIIQFLLVLVVHSPLPLTSPDFSSKELNKPHNFDKADQFPKNHIKPVRVFIKPEQVGLPKDFPHPVVQDRIFWKCPCCNMKMSTHVVYPSNPNCPKKVDGGTCGCFMNEIE